VDIRTGRTYETLEQAVADGVPESDVAEVVTRHDGTHWVRFQNTRYPQRHQSSREMSRRAKRIAADLTPALP
jgi:hypothetical protein